jgi:hypothetical protein
MNELMLRIVRLMLTANPSREPQFMAMRDGLVVEIDEALAAWQPPEPETVLITPTAAAQH